jgi:hypothetical protein
MTRGQRGSPIWFLLCTNTTEDHEMAQWAARSGVGPEVFDLEWPDQ